MPFRKTLSPQTAYKSILWLSESHSFFFKIRYQPCLGVRANNVFVIRSFVLSFLTVSELNEYDERWHQAKVWRPASVQYLYRIPSIDSHSRALLFSCPGPPSQRALRRCDLPVVSMERPKYRNYTFTQEPFPFSKFQVFSFLVVTVNYRFWAWIKVGYTSGGKWNEENAWQGMVGCDMYDNRWHRLGGHALQ